jgi:hypothetical protein
MTKVRFASLVAEALWGFVEYDLVSAVFGFGSIYRRLAAAGGAEVRSDLRGAEVVSRAIELAACFYWKPVLCLQRSVVMVAVLKKRGIRANVVIGYRGDPFFAHAWVEVDGRVLNDSAAFPKRLRILCRI